jgi:pimeloyl-ACP methyl ester carboxylesterase
LNNGGPADVTNAVIKALNLTNMPIVLSGYDWGSSIALAMASK